MNLRHNPVSPPSLLCGLVFLALAVPRCPSQAPPEAEAVFFQYTAAAQRRLVQQHRSRAAFLPLNPQEELRLHRGELIVEQLAPTTQPTEALLSHWRGTAFVPRATAVQFEQVLRDFGSYPHTFAPQIVEAHAQPLGSSNIQVTMRVRQKHVITIVMDASYDVTFGHLDEQNGYSVSKSRHIREIDAPGTDRERALTPAEEHGFLWKLTTFWTYQQRDDGLYLQVETVSLSRSIPAGLGWALRPYMTSVPRESLEFTLRAATNALHK